VTTDREQYLLERCLRLEAEVARLRGYAVAPLEPEITRPAASPLVPRIQLKRHVQRRASAADIAQMHDLRRRGLTPVQIGRQLGFSDTAVRGHTRDVLMEREIGS